MPVYDIYSKRKRQQERAGQPDVYKYDEIPEGLRNQIIYIWQTAIGTWIKGNYDYSDQPPDSIWIAIHSILCRELGLKSLGKERERPFTNCCSFLLEQTNIDYILSLIEVSFRMIERVCPDLSSSQKYRAGIRAGWSDLTLRPIYTFLYRYFIRLGILDGFPGFFVSVGGAAACFAKYAFLKELETQ